mmetsp:Transcript_21983/g.46752  ORF Transcript_21983/g.46752 Transcript_21983/m.46752 type:complete len:283 (+) Transcript_21983:77-925(+)
MLTISRRTSKNHAVSKEATIEATETDVPTTGPPPFPGTQADKAERQDLNAVTAAAASDLVTTTTASLARFTPRLKAFLPRLASRLGEAALADVTLCADGVEFPCHRLVLACSSEYFSAMFEGSFAESQVGSQIQLPGKSSESVQAVLRVLYCEASVHEVLADEPSRVLQVLELAHEWLLPDLAEGCIEFVKTKIHDIGTLEHICASMSFGENMRVLREICHERLRQLRNKEIAKTAGRGLPLGADGAEEPSQRTPLSRWPAATGSGSERWSSPVSCPKGFRA